MKTLAALALAVSLLPSEQGVVGRVQALPVVATIELSDTELRTGERFHAEVTVTNVGSSTVGGVVQLRAPGLVVLGADRVNLDPILPGASERVQWPVCAPRIGNFVVMATVEFGSFSVDTAAQLVRVTRTGSARCR